MPTEPSEKKTFIFDQRLHVLEPVDGATLSLKQALSLSSLPEYEAMYSPYGKWDRDAEKREFWKTIDSSRERTEFLKFLGGNADAPLTERRLLCVTSSAGIGKSIALSQARFLRNDLPGHVVLYYHLSQFPDSVDSFWGRGSCDATHESVFARIGKQLSASKSECPLPKAYYPGIEAWLTSKMTLGQVTLFIDGLDEVDSSNARPRAVAMKSILDEYKNLHCMVAGRPYAITDAYWNTIFGITSEPGHEDHSSYWKFCCVGMFDQKQIERSLGPTRAKRIQELAGELELTPRTIEVLRKLPEEKFVVIKTIADVYWQSLSETLKIDVEHQTKGLKTIFTSKISIEQYVEYLAALAITMLDRKTMKVNYKGIRNAILKRLVTIPGWANETINELDKKQEAIKELNTGWVEFHFFLDASEEIHWRNKTLRDFFAALWLVRHSGDNERSQAIQNIPRVVLEFRGNKSIAPDYQELWSFISTMPSGAIETGELNDHQRWLQLIAALFVQSGNHPRPSEMMARSWPRLCKLSEGDHDDNARAKRIIEKFLAEFDTLKTAVPTKEIIAQDLVFTEIELQRANVEVEVGHYVMGDYFKDNPQHKEKLAGTFALFKYAITRRLYACFDPNHIKHFTTEFENYAADERCPVICITFWDAWMFAVWCGGRLPTEWEWEFACRADCRDKDNRLSLYYWPDDNEGDRLKDHAWCERNSDGKTRRVGILQPNKYGLHDMLGNVWEWTDSIYEAGGVSRVLRGGSFVDFGRGASASCRFHFDPAYASIFSGFRVARAPKGKS